MAIDPKKVVGGIFGAPGTGGFLEGGGPAGFGAGKSDTPYSSPNTTPGPYDYLREKMPEGYDEGDWEKFVDLLNTDYRRATPGERKKLLKRSVNELISYGQSKGSFRTPIKKKKQAVVQSIQESATGTALRENQQYTNVADAIDAANAGDAAGLATLTSQFEGLNEQDQNALADYLSATDPMMAEIFARTSDPADVQRQLDAYNEQKGVVDKYKSLTDPTVTAQERYMSELARREFEAADKSNREAVSEQMANRGLRSGGQEIAANQSSQQQLAQDRLLKELGIQGQAVGRSMQAMEGWSNATNQLGLQSNAIRSANDSQRQYEDDFKRQEAERRSKLAGERRGAVNDTTGIVGGRNRDIYGAGVDSRGRTVGRAGELAGLGIDIAGRQHGRVVETGGIEADSLTDEDEDAMAFGGGLA